MAYLCKQVSKHLHIAHKSKLAIPNRLSVKYKPMLVARAVIGHSLAAHIVQDVNEPPKQGQIQQAMRDFVLNDRADVPPSLDIYWWFYPSNIEVAINYAAVVRWGRHDHALFGNFLKFFPFAFWIVFERPAALRINLPQLAPNRNADLDDEVQRDISLQCPIDVNWPERPGDDEVVLLPDNSYVISRPRRSSKKSNL